MRAAALPWRVTAKANACLARQSGRANRAHVPINSPPSRSFSLLRQTLSRGILCLSTTGCRHIATTHALEPTIYALSTAPGRAAIAVIRISGSSCLDIYEALCPGKTIPKPRHATLRTLYQPGSEPTEDSVLDSNALILYFPAPRTVTGEEVLELHVHGGPAVVKAVLAAVPQSSIGSSNSSIRYAEPGEFTRRAFLNDRLDLTQVEALGETLTATTEQQRRLAMRGTTGKLAKRYESWRQQLLYARGELEALIDFSEDQHFDTSPAELCSSVAAQVRVLRRKLEVHKRNAMRGELLRSGISISLLGAPNAGKSSLLNRIVGREAAIVSQEAGTTRDVVEVGLDLGGYFCRVGDTAGLRQARQEALRSSNSQEVIGQIEREGMRRAKERAIESDLVIVVLSFERRSRDKIEVHLDPEVLRTAAALIAEKDNVVVAINKSDVCRDHANAVQQVLAALPGLTADKIHLLSCKEAGQPDQASNQSQPQNHPANNSAPTSIQSHTIPTSSEIAAAPLSSAKTNTHDLGHIQAFLHGLIIQFSALTAAITPQSKSLGADVDASIWQESLGASERQRLLLRSCQAHLDDFLAAVEVDEGVAGPGENEVDVVVAAEHLRSAAQSLARITGAGEAGDVEEVLGVVFEKFCVGK